MHVHRSAHVRNFTVLPNALLQYRRLSYTARGILADLLSRPDGWREDGRHMADSSPQGRGAVRKALKELTDAGFYRVEKVRLPDGTIRTDSHVYDTPQLGLPGTTRPGPGGANAGGAGVPVVKNRSQRPSLPDGPVAGGADEDRAACALPDEQVREAVAVLFRVIRPEPRLRLGEAEARELAPQVAQWLERGATREDLAAALLPGLPLRIHSAVAVLRHRLEHKVPPAQTPARAAPARYDECAECRDPIPRPGVCRRCAGHPVPAVVVGADEACTRSGAARARTALRAAKPTACTAPGGRPVAHYGSVGHPG
ncbi:hypothetical protein ACIPYS_07230 [Kitasatospora sp. NPDC089913]|uniref:hypothetical protein n=1 Tax=Kitasatospora sp. NPDC089913 TaxID=3364080 RepID=UPI00380C0CBB